MKRILQFLNLEGEFLQKVVTTGKHVRLRLNRTQCRAAILKRIYNGTAVRLPLVGDLFTRNYLAKLRENQSKSYAIIAANTITDSILILYS